MRACRNFCWVPVASTVREIASAANALGTASARSKTRDSNGDLRLSFIQDSFESGIDSLGHDNPADRALSGLASSLACAAQVFPVLLGLVGVRAAKLRQRLGKTFA